MKTEKKNDFKKLSCHPRKTRRSFTCYNDTVLIELRDLWNKKYPDKKILHTDAKKIWKSLHNNMKECDQEVCWMEKLDKSNKKDITKDYFAPVPPKEWKTNDREWLSNEDIDEVLDQYQKVYPEFAYIHASPMDFDKKLGDHCVTEDLCKLNLQAYRKKGKTKIGIVLNLDPHDRDGSHWVCMWIDLNKKILFYFDSAGNPPPKEVNVFAERLKKQGKEIGLTLKYRDNRNKAHQTTTSECGMYVLYFIIHLLKKKKKLTTFNRTRIEDDEVAKYRDVYFNRLIAK